MVLSPLEWQVFIIFTFPLLKSQLAPAYVIFKDLGINVSWLFNIVSSCRAPVWSGLSSFAFLVKAFWGTCVFRFVLVHAQ